MEDKYKGIHRYFSLLFVFLALMLGTAQAGEGLRPGDFKSKWLKITSGGMTGEKGGKPVIILGLKNKKREPLWVTVRIDVPEPSQDCESTKKFTSKEKVIFDCPQEGIVADTDYPIYINIFSDENLTTLVEENSTKMNFPKSSVDAFLAWLAPPTFPSLFNNLVYSKKPGIASAHFGGMFKSRGTVVVHKDKIEYKKKKKIIITIPFSQITSIFQKQFGPNDSDSMVVVKYQSENENKIIGFGVNPFAMGPLDDMYSTLKYAYKSHRTATKANEKVQLGFDKREWRVGYTGEQGDQAVTEYVLPGETVENWMELVTLQTFRGFQTSTSVKKTMLWVKELTVKNCPDVMWKIIREAENEILYEWSTINCPGFDNQYEVAKILRGNAGIYRAAYASKRFPISDDKRNQWIELIGQAKMEVIKP